MLDGLYPILVLLPFATLILLIVALVRLGSLTAELGALRQQLNKLLEGMGGSPVQGVARHPSGEQPSAPASPPPQTPPPFVAPAPVPPGIVPERVITASAGPLVQERAHPSPPAERPRPVSVDPPPAGPSPPPLAPHPTFSSRHPDLEKFIGENLINKIGIAVLVVGVGFLLNYAIVQGYIGAVGQTLIGLLAGGALVFFAHRSRTNFRAFSSVLVAGGIAVFYFTVGFAFHKYHLLGQTAAFLSMVGITGIAVLFTLGYDRKELAVIALLGGFGTPFMVSTGEGNYRVLFTYLLILDVGMLVLANYKKWPVINVIAFALSWLLFAVWGITIYPDLGPRPIWGAFGFASGFYAVFIAMILSYDLRHRSLFTTLDHGMFIMNTAVYFGLGLFFLADLPLRVGGLFTAMIGIVNLLLALRFFRDQQVPRDLVHLLIGLVLTFLSLSAPVQLEGSHITLFWAAESVLLLWFSQRSGLKLIDATSRLVLVVMVISLVQDLIVIYTGDTASLRPVLNRGCITGMAASLALFLYARRLRHQDPKSGVLFPAERLRSIVEVVLTIVLYAAAHLELAAQLAKLLSPAAVQMALAAYSTAFVLVLDLLLAKRRRPARWAVAALLVLRVLLLVTTYYAVSREVLAEHLSFGGGALFPVLHGVTLALTVLAVVHLAKLARALLTRGSIAWRVYVWVMCTVLVVIASQELDHALILMGGHDGLAIPDALTRARKWGYPLLWGAGSFMMMLYGMRTRLQDVRIFSLALFGVTLFKLFLFDIRGVSEGGKVAAFIGLGVLLLIVSFLYQRLKGLLIDGPDAGGPKPDAPN